MKLILNISIIVVFALFHSEIKSAPIDSVQKELDNLSPKEKITYLSNLSWSLRERDTDNALRYGKQAIKLADSLGFTNELGIASNYVGVILLHYQYRIKEAVPYFHAALEIALQFNDTLRIGYSYNNLGDVYYLTGNAPLALDYAERSMNYSDAANDSLAIAYSHINFGLAHGLEENYESAIEHFNKAITIRKKLNNKLGFASAQHQIGDVYFEMGDYETAMKYYQKSYEHNEEIDNKKWMAFSLDGIGNILFMREQYDAALNHIEQSLKLNEERDHVYGIIDNKLGKALIYSKTNRKEEGEEELFNALKLAKELDVPLKLLETYKTFARFYLNLREFDSAVSHFDSFIEMYDSLYLAQQFEALSELQNNFDVQQKLRESERSLEIQRIEELYLIAILVLVSFLTFVLFWRYRIKKKLTIELQRSNDSKDKLFSILSHDLRNPFFTLQGYIQLLKDESLDEDDKRKCINDLETTANSTYALLENLLNLSASRRGMIEYNPENFNIRELVDQVVSNLKPQLDKKYINVENKIEDKEIFADSNMIEVILRNLLSNAIKYSTNNGKIYLSSKTNHSFYVSVEDTGIGMNEEIQKNLFKSDFLQSQRGTAGEKGTGIGLSLCKDFIEKHNGAIKVKSKLDEGTEFTFCIPQKN